MKGGVKGLFLHLRVESAWSEGREGGEGVKNSFSDDWVFLPSTGPSPGATHSRHRLDQMFPPTVALLFLEI